MPLSRLTHTLPLDFAAATSEAEAPPVACEEDLFVLPQLVQALLPDVEPEAAAELLEADPVAAPELEPGLVA